MDREEARRIERRARLSAAGEASADELNRLIADGLEATDDPGTVGLLLLASVVGNQWKVDPAEASDEALRAAALLTEAGEAGAAVFAETAGAVMLLRAGALDQATGIAVRTLAAVEDLPANEEWGSRTANALGVIFGELHAFELAAQSTTRALSWAEAANDPTARVMIDSVRGYYAGSGSNDGRQFSSAATRTPVSRIGVRGTVP